MVKKRKIRKKKKKKRGIEGYKMIYHQLPGQKKIIIIIIIIITSTYEPFRK